MMSIDIKNIEVEVKGRFTSLTLRGNVSYGYCRDVTYLRPDSESWQFPVDYHFEFGDTCFRDYISERYNKQPVQTAQQLLSDSHFIKYSPIRQFHDSFCIKRP